MSEAPDDNEGQMEVHVDIRKVPSVQADGSTKLVTCSELAEQFISYQRQYYAAQLNRVRRQVAQFNLDDESKQMLIAYSKCLLNGNHDHCERKARALAASGMRLPDDSLH